MAKPPRHQRGWSRAENARLVELRAAGVTWEQCARTLGRTMSSVMHHDAHLKTPSPPRIRWTDEENALLRALRAAGLTWNQVAERTGWKKTTAQAQMKRLRKADLNAACAAPPELPPPPVALLRRDPPPDTLAAVRRRAGLEHDGRAERLAARRAANDARVQQAHQVRMAASQDAGQAGCHGG